MFAVQRGGNALKEMTTVNSEQSSTSFVFAFVRRQSGFDSHAANSPIPSWDNFNGAKDAVRMAEIEAGDKTAYC